MGSGLRGEVRYDVKGLWVGLLEDYLVELAVLELYLSVLIVEEGLDVPRFAGVIEVAVLDAEVAEDSLLA